MSKRFERAERFARWVLSCWHRTWRLSWLATVGLVGWVAVQMFR